MLTKLFFSYFRKRKWPAMETYLMLTTPTQGMSTFGLNQCFNVCKQQKLKIACFIRFLANAWAASPYIYKIRIASSKSKHELPAADYRWFWFSCQTSAYYKLVQIFDYYIEQSVMAGLGFHRHFGKKNLNCQPKLGHFKVL